MPNRIVINEYIDLVWTKSKPVIFVAGKEFIGCSFLAVSLPAADAARVESIDELADDKRSRSLEGRDAMEVLGMTVDDVMQAHASNLIAWVENGYDTRILHSNLSFSLLKELAKAGDTEALRVLHGEINDRLASGSKIVALTVIECCLEYVDEKGLSSLATNENTTVRHEVAKSPSTPAGILDRLAGDVYGIVRREVAKNQNTPAGVIERLAGDGFVDVRQNVAINPKTPTSALERLAGDDEVTVRREVANNTATPAIVLGLLAGDRSASVRYNVAYNPSTPPGVLERLAVDDNVSVRANVASNRRTPPEVLERLAGDESSVVRVEAVRNPKTPPHHP